MFVFKALGKMHIRSSPTTLTWSASLLHTNHDATQLLRRLKSDEKASSSSSPTTIDRAFNVYYDIKHVPNHFAINALLKLLLHCKSPGHVNRVWGDIQNASFLRSETASMTYPLWLKCCIAASDISMQQCVDMIEWTRNHQNEQIQMDVDSLVALVEKCETLKTLRYVHSLMKQQYLCVSGGDAAATNKLFTSLVVAYCRAGDVRSALHVVENEGNADTVMVNQAIRALVDGGHYLQAIYLYFNNYTKRNSATDKLVETAWSNLDRSGLQEVELLFI